MCINVLFLGNLFPILLSVTKQHIFRSATPAIETDRFTRGKINFLMQPGTAPRKLWVEKISEIVSQNAISSLSSFWTLTISSQAFVATGFNLIMNFDTSSHFNPAHRQCDFDREVGKVIFFFQKKQPSTWEKLFEHSVFVCKDHKNF